VRLPVPCLALLATGLIGCAAPVAPVVVRAVPMPADAPAAMAAPASVTQQGAPADSLPLVAADEVSRRTAELFGAAGTIADSAEDSDDAPPAPSWDIEVRSYETLSRVEHFVRMFSGPSRDRISDRLSRGTMYEPMIRQALRDGGLPEDMYFLALIESGFDPNAYSRAAAVGMWQFMATTARGVGLRVDWWIDERRDPVRSTHAAVRFLRELNGQFGSMYLAAAAYNGGPGRIARGLTRYAGDLNGSEGDDRFFALAEKDYLPAETRDYVPQLIAAALVGKDPSRYDVTIEPRAPLTYDSVRVPALTPLSAVAAAAGATVGEIRQLNPHILRGLVPAGTPLELRIPAGSAGRFAAAFDSLPVAERVGARTVRSKTGQTMATIARDAGITTAQLGWYNPSVRRAANGRLVAGQTIMVPTRATVAAAADVPDPAIERYGTTVVGARSHVVKSGDTLGAIAIRYGTTVAALRSANKLKRDIIVPGQRLVIPGR
jgi:membrane-bound lytic murein transglycosylase D